MKIEFPQTEVERQTLNEASLPLDGKGWRASLGLRFADRSGKTVLLDRTHCGPLRVQRPFYPESDSVCHVYLVHPPGGIVGGDGLEIHIDIDENAKGLLTTPGATKIYRSNGRTSIQRTEIRIASQASIEWLPQETILFDGANSDALVRVDLDVDAIFMGGEITCLGRPASGEYLSHCNVRHRFELWRNNVPLLLERARYVTGHPVMKADWGLQNYPVVGLFACSRSDPSLLEAVRTGVVTDSNALFAATELQGVLICRYLGEDAEQAKEILRQAWRVLRPLVLKENAVEPRIWNT